MQPPSRPLFGIPLTYECPRCGDTYQRATEDDRFQATVHQLLHMAGDWRRSSRPATYWMTGEDVPRP